MTDGYSSRPIDERFKHLLAVVSSPRFLQRRGLGNEVPFFICPYLPAEHLEMERVRVNLVKQLSHKGVRICEINLYDISIEILARRQILDQIIEQEDSFSKEQLMELLQGVLDPEAHLVPEIATRLSKAQFDAMFISGVGEVFPFIRSHNVLNNLQTPASNLPTILFFPGNYSYSPEKGTSLDLFGVLHDDKYYRAFNIFHYEV